MAKFTLLVRVQNATQDQLQQLVGCLEMQSNPDWELVLVTGESRLVDQALVAELTLGEPKLRHEVRPDDELIEWSCNALLDSLGTWIGFMGQQDLLLPETLAKVEEALNSAPQTQVVYTDEEGRNRFGHIAARFAKGAINPLRLLTQEYLRDLALIRKSWIQDQEGFSRMASDWPRHDFYLRTLEAKGPAAFLNIPERLFQRFWNPRFPVHDARRKTHMVGFDLYGIQESLKRQGLTATVRQRGGSAEVAYRFSRRPWVTLLVVNDGSALMEQALQDLAEHTEYRPLTIKAIPGGAGLVDRLNQGIQGCDTDLACVLWGLPINPLWLKLLVDHWMVPGAGAVGARLCSPSRLTQPGLLNYRFKGWDWNSRGRFNELAVPHQVSALSPHALLLDPRVHLAMGQFNPELEKLFAMDLCLRMDAAGFANRMVPAAQVMVQESVPDLTEVAVFWQIWPGWSDRFGLHLSPE